MYEIQKGSYDENYKFYNELCRTLPEGHPKRVKMLKVVNDIAKSMTKNKNSL